jgi:16S rRNA (adenine1518-N6/adenine1519-N6)-dimethyltransferase
MTAPRTLLKAWGMRARKSMGQNFLADPHLAVSIVEAGSFEKQDIVVEIGAGLGALTIPLASRTKHVFAVEPDKAIAGLLRNELLAAAASNVTIIEEDILRCDIKAFVGTKPKSFKVAGNLPYHLSTQVLLLLIALRPLVDCAVLMFQKEVAERLAAPPGNKTYGRLSVLVQYCAAVSSVTRVAAGAFYPKPKVDSTVVKITFFDTPPFPALDEPFFFQVIRAAFGKRRKMLKNALLGSDIGVEEQTLQAAFKKSDIAPQRRAETLSVQDFVKLSNALRSINGEGNRSKTNQFVDFS